MVCRHLYAVVIYGDRFLALVPNVMPPMSAYSKNQMCIMEPNSVFRSTLKQFVFALHRHWHSNHLVLSHLLSLSFGVSRCLTVSMFICSVQLLITVIYKSRFLICARSEEKFGWAAPYVSGAKSPLRYDMGFYIYETSLVFAPSFLLSLLWYSTHDYTIHKNHCRTILTQPHTWARDAARVYNGKKAYHGIRQH